MSSLKKVAIVIPFHKNTLDPYEEVSLLQCEKILNGHPIIAVKPNHLTLPIFTEKLNLTKTISFGDENFKSYKSYNALLMSEHFYNAFLDYEYILIYQSDVFVFSDELNYWCDTGYDYIGAPWLQIKNYSKIKTFFYNYLYKIYYHFNIKKLGLSNSKQFTNRVGNGGFSLRKVATFSRLCKELSNFISTYVSNNETIITEDIFWCIEVNRKKKYLNIPNLKTAALFALENRPDVGIKINKGKLPFGCHAWEKYLDFWRPIFKEHGYDI